jgi:hypothetical protein
MCLIIDANVVARVFLQSEDKDFAGLFGAGNPRVRIACGGRLRREYVRNAEVKRQLARLDRAGRARLIPDADVDAEEKVVAGTGLCVSDDQHVIALARVSGVRLLCSHDKALHQDFTNKGLVDRPRGKVYQHSGHHRLLVSVCS